MEYARLYERFIESRREKESSLTGYVEKHHVLPRSLGGRDEPSNIIRLTAEDHFFAHLLLAKAHGGKMWYALVAMTLANDGRAVCNGFLRRARRVIAAARVKAAEVHSAAMKGRFCGEDHPMYGRPCSELSKRKTRERFASGLNPMNSPEARAKLSAKLKGRVFSDETRAKISASKMGKPRSEESRMKQSQTMTGRKLSEEHKLNVSRANTGKKRSPEHIQRMRELNLGKMVGIPEAC
jgi:hypothetical protein